MSVRARVVTALLNRHAHNCTHQEGPTMPTDPHSSPVETTEGSARPIPPDAPNKASSGSETLTSVLAQMPGTRLLIDAEVAAKDAEIERLTAEVEGAWAEVTRQVAGRNVEQAMLRNVLPTIAAKDALIAELDKAGLVLANEVERLEATIARMRTGRP